MEAPIATTEWLRAAFELKLFKTAQPIFGLFRRSLKPSSSAFQRAAGAGYAAQRRYEHICECHRCSNGCYSALLAFRFGQERVLGKREASEIRRTYSDLSLAQYLVSIPFLTVDQR